MYIHPFIKRTFFFGRLIKHNISLDKSFTPIELLDEIVSGFAKKERKEPYPVDFDIAYFYKVGKLDIENDEKYDGKLKIAYTLKSEFYNQLKKQREISVAAVSGTYCHTVKYGRYLDDYAIQKDEYLEVYVSDDIILTKEEKQIISDFIDSHNFIINRDADEWTNEEWDYNLLYTTELCKLLDLEVFHPIQTTSVKKCKIDSISKLNNFLSSFGSKPLVDYRNSMYSLI